MTSVLFILDKHACTIIILIGEIFTKKKTNNKRPYVKYLVNPKTQGDRNLAIKILYHIYIYSHTISYPWRSYI